MSESNPAPGVLPGAGQPAGMTAGLQEKSDVAIYSQNHRSARDCP
jgi:hypothetical protein